MVDLVVLLVLVIAAPVAPVALVAGGVLAISSPRCCSCMRLEPMPAPGGGGEGPFAELSDRRMLCMACAQVSTKQLLTCTGLPVTTIIENRRDLESVYMQVRSEITSHDVARYRAPLTLLKSAGKTITRCGFLFTGGCVVFVYCRRKSDIFRAVLGKQMSPH